MTNFFQKLRGHSSANEDISAILNQLVSTKTSVPVQIEGSNSWFQSRVMLRSGSVLLGYPQPLHNVLSPGTWVRLILPMPPSRVLRLEVAKGQYNPGFSKAQGHESLMLICRLHGAAILPNPRRHMRYDTRRYRDLVLNTVQPPDTFKVVDLSKSGLRIKAAPELMERFHLGEHIKGAMIRLGSKSRVRLMEVRICSQTDNGIGMEMVLPAEGSSEKVLDVFLRWLHGETLKRLGQQAAI